MRGEGEERKGRGKGEGNASFPSLALASSLTGFPVSVFITQSTLEK